MLSIAVVVDVLPGNWAHFRLYAFQLLAGLAIGPFIWLLNRNLQDAVWDAGDTIIAQKGEVKILIPVNEITDLCRSISSRSPTYIITYNNPETGVGKIRYVPNDYVSLEGSWTAESLRRRTAKKTSNPNQDLDKDSSSVN